MKDGSDCQLWVRINYDLCQKSIFMSITLRLAKLDHGNELVRPPQMSFDAGQPAYWILLPVFEKIEAKTGKLIDLGSSELFEPEELDKVIPIVEEELKENKETSKEQEEELILATDDEIRVDLLERFGAMVKLGIKYRTKLLVEAEG